MIEINKTIIKIRIFAIPLVNLIKEHTRTDRRKAFLSEKSIDNVFTNITESTAQIIEPIISDHTAKITTLNLPDFKNHINCQIEILTRKYSEQNMRNFCYFLHRDFHSILHPVTDVNYWYDKFSELFHFFHPEKHNTIEQAFFTT